MREINSFRVLVKGLLIFLAANILFSLANPSIASFSPFNRVIPGFERYPIIQTPIKDANGTISYSTEVVSNLGVLFPSHVISAQPKPKDEYRVILIGDSSVRGALLPVEQTVAGQINKAQLITCDHRRVVTYNLGLPGTALEDMMILSEAIKNYHPDLIVWSFSLYSLARAQDQAVVDANLDQIHELEQSTGYSFVPNSDLSQASSFMDRTFYGRSGDLELLLRLSFLDINYLAIGTDEPRILNSFISASKEPVGRKDDYSGLKTGADITQKMDPNFLRAAKKISGSVPVIYVNEPIYMAPNNPIRYNATYPRWAYDQYRDVISSVVREQSLTYLDLWNLVPPAEFTNSVFHRTAKGETLVMQKLIPVIQTQACNK